MNNTSLLHVFVVTWNEQKYLQELIDWYKTKVPNCRITLLDNMSDDDTIAIATRNGCEISQFDTNGKMAEERLIEIRNNCWKSSNCEFVLVVDADEFVNVDVKALTEANWNIAVCRGFEMIGEGEPIEELVYGNPAVGYNKPCIWRKSAIKESNLAPGSHTSNPTPNTGVELVYANEEERPHLYHTKWREFKSGLERQHLLATRVSDQSKLKGWNFHYALSDAIHTDYYQSNFNNRTKIR